MNFEPYIERIENYLAGELSDSERAAFEGELATNEELRRALELSRIGEEVIELEVENSLRNQLEQWAAADAGQAAQPLNQSAHIVPMRQRAWVRRAVAASVVLLAGFFIWQWAGGRYSDESLFAANYEMPEPSTFRAGGEVAHPLESGFQALEKGDYHAAESFFQSIPPENERFAEAQYYLGHAASQLKHEDLAIRAFAAAASGGDARFQEKAEWNLVLAIMAANQTGADFQALLNKIAQDSGHSFHEQAKELQRKLASFWRHD